MPKRSTARHIEGTWHRERSQNGITAVVGSITNYRRTQDPAHPADTEGPASKTSATPSAHSSILTMTAATHSHGPHQNQESRNFSHAILDSGGKLVPRKSEET